MVARSTPAPTTERLGRDERRQALLDAAALLVEAGSLDDVTMEAVAERAGVSRPLVYKHFANREEMLAEVLRREARALHEEMAAVVGAAADVEDMFRALVRTALQAAAERGRLFAALRSAGAGGVLREVGREQRDRDRTTAKAFTRRAAAELGIDDDRRAATAIGLLLGLIDQVIAQFRPNPTRARAAHLEDVYLTIVRATLQALRDP